MQGILYLKNHRYLFTTDTHHDDNVVAWMIDIDVPQRQQRYLWERVPVGGVVELFDFDNPPATVGYIPLLMI